MSMSSNLPTNREWLRRMLSGRPHQVIGDPAAPYLLRWYVVPRNPWFNVYLHKFLRDDDDRALHDHPWPWRRRGLVYRPATWRHRVALPYAVDEHGHVTPEIREANQKVPCWTLIVTGRRTREWGFWCPQSSKFLERRLGKRFVPWREFGDAGCGEVA